MAVGYALINKVDEVSPAISGNIDALRQLDIKLQTADGRVIHHAHGQ